VKVVLNRFSLVALFGISSFVLSCSTAPSEPTRATAAAVDSRPLEERLEAGIAKRLERGLGWGFAGFYRNGEKNAVIVRGKRSLEPPVLLMDQSVLEIGSVSKTFTGILVHIAVLEGRLRLDTRLEELLPNLQGKPAGTITVEDLGLHRSGLPRALAHTGTTDPMNPYRNLKEKDLLGALESWSRPATPVVRDYSNVGYEALGLVLEKTYRRKFADLVREKIARPLGLGETAIDRGSRRRGRFVPKVVSGYDAAGDVRPAWDFPGVFAAAGGIEMNAREIRSFVEKLIQPPTSLVGRAIEASMASGIGWDSNPGAPTVLKNGMTGGFSAVLLVNRSERRGLMIVGNSKIDPTGLGAYAMGILPADPLVTQVEQGRARVPDAEILALKGKYSFRRVLDDDEDEVDVARLPAGELEAAPKAIEVLEQFMRMVARIGDSSPRLGVFLTPAAKEGEWTLIDGLYNLGDRFVLEGDGKDLRLKVAEKGTSGKSYWLEYRKLDVRPETFPAYEKE
jgi:CubicO group peptidase (beta-lactamase class C family)